MEMNGRQRLDSIPDLYIELCKDGGHVLFIHGSQLCLECGGACAGFQQDIGKYIEVAPVVDPVIFWKAGDGGQDVEPELRIFWNVFYNGCDLVHLSLIVLQRFAYDPVRFDNWKYRETRSSQSNPGAGGVIKELFNLGYDPGERTNVIDDFPDQAREGKTLFDAFDGKKPN